jgi:CheY-like chemotaxis protein
MSETKILWADDEIDLLKPYILFLENKGYQLVCVNSATDALEQIEKQAIDLVLLDENMPGMTGLEALPKIKKSKPNLPVIMVTKSEEENIMEEAIGSKIADYLIKPLNPNQILLSIKKVLDNKRLVSEKTTMNYQQDFKSLSLRLEENLSPSEWADIYKQLIYWELELEKSQDKSMVDILVAQKAQANQAFCKYVERNYEQWVDPTAQNRPLLSPQLMRKKVFPLLKTNDPVFFLLIDNLRYDQWKTIEPLIAEMFRVEEESSYFSILPTATQFARNAIFSGMMPSEMEKQFPNLWVNDSGENEEGLNMHEEEWLQIQMQRSRLQHKMSYHKILSPQQGKQLVDNFPNLLKNELNVVVYNFVDMLSHARTDMNMIKELANDESAYRSISASWVQHGSIMDFLEKVAQAKGRLIITTDHGMIRVTEPVKIIGDKSVNSNLRYKQGKNLNYENPQQLMVCKNPEKLFLPKQNVSTSYVFTKNDTFLVYPNNYNHFVNHYRNTFQHGGVSLEEMIIPFVTLTAK